MLISLALIWASVQMNNLVPLLFLFITWIPDIAIAFALFDYISHRKRGVK